MPNVNPKILQWARETAGLSLGEAASKLNIADSKKNTGAEKLQAYEEGKPPSRSLLLRMAKQYRRPILTFYLREKPIVQNRGEDFRVLTNEIDPTKDAIVDALLRSIKARQSIVKAALISEGDTRELRFVGSYTRERGVAGLVESISKTCGFSLNDYRNQRNQTEAFKYLRSKIESAGIFTILAGNLGSHHTNLSVDVFRGFALSDQIAPFVVINNQDAKAAWSFTLLHEVAHLWLGETGISGGYGELAVEQFCDLVASEILLPNAEFQEFQVVNHQANIEELVATLDAYASARKISSRMVAYRLFRRTSISAETYREIGALLTVRWQEMRERTRQQASEDDGGPSYYIVTKFRLGDALTSTAKRMLSSGELSTTQAGTLLGVRALKVGNLLAGNGAV